MKEIISSLRTVSLAILLIGFVLSASSCASSKANARRRVIGSEQSFRQAGNHGLYGTGQPDRAPQNKVQTRKTMKGPYKPQQGNSQQNSGSQGEHKNDNGLSAAIGGVIGWIFNGLFGGGD